MSRRDRIVVVCPGGVSTGGPEALHQLAHMINELNVARSAILYRPFDNKFDCHPSYLDYRVPIIQQEDLGKDDILVLPEVWPNLVNVFDNRCILWWLSVDYAPFLEESEAEKFMLFLAQSDYALEFVKHKFKTPSLYVNDFINDDYFTRPQLSTRQNTIIYSFKGQSRQEKFIEQYPEFQGHSLGSGGKNSRDEVIKLLDGSAIYVDFGDQPGQDRLPREASSRGCVVLCLLAGSSRHDKDMPLPAYYKFTNLDELASKLREVQSNWEYHQNKQLAYRRFVQDGKQRFKEQVKNFIMEINNIYTKSKLTDSL